MHTLLNCLQSYVNKSAVAEYVDWLNIYFYV